MMETMNKEDELVEHKELATFLFKESQCHAQTTRAKLGAGKYDFVAKVFNTASARQLNRYKGTDKTTEDGVTCLTIMIMAQTMASYYCNKEVVLGDKT
eukprot:4048513-Ditylum_brightwellii.AAC.1